jgi:hypothetical protein
MKLKNKKLLSILLGLEMTISFAGCEGLKDYNTSQNDTTYHTSQNSTTYSSASQYTTYKSPVSETTTEEKEEPFIEDEAYVCALANLNLRKAPNLSSEVLEVIPKFSKLRKEKTNGTFDYISYDGTYGYVSHKYIEKLTNPSFCFFLIFIKSSIKPNKAYATNTNKTISKLLLILIFLVKYIIIIVIKVGIIKINPPTVGIPFFFL